MSEKLENVDVVKLGNPQPFPTSAKISFMSQAELSMAIKDYLSSFMNDIDGVMVHTVNGSVAVEVFMAKNTSNPEGKIESLEEVIPASRDRKQLAGLNYAEKMGIVSDIKAGRKYNVSDDTKKIFANFVFNSYLEKKNGKMIMPVDSKHWTESRNNLPAIFTEYEDRSDMRGYYVPSAFVVKVRVLGLDLNKILQAMYGRDIEVDGDHSASDAEYLVRPAQNILYYQNGMEAYEIIQVSATVAKIENGRRQFIQPTAAAYQYFR